MRNKIFVITVASAFIIILMIFGLLHVKYDTYTVGNARFEGGVSSLKLLNPLKSQENIVKKLSYVRDTAKEWDLGFGFIDNIEKVRCKYIDQEGFSKQYDLAVTDVEGEYPQGANEIMVSRRTLSDLGISEPHVGMEIQIDINGTRNFILSGYFTDYSEYFLPKAFLSKAYMDKVKGTDGVTECLIIYDTLDSSTVDVRESICTALDIKNDDTQLIGNGSIDPAGSGLDNSYLGYLFMVAMILICAYFLINSSFAITINIAAGIPLPDTVLRVNSISYYRYLQIVTNSHRVRAWRDHENALHNSLGFVQKHPARQGNI